MCKECYNFNDGGKYSKIDETMRRNSSKNYRNKSDDACSTIFFLLIGFIVIVAILVVAVILVLSKGKLEDPKDVLEEEKVCERVLVKPDEIEEGWIIMEVNDYIDNKERCNRSLSPFFPIYLYDG